MNEYIGTLNGSKQVVWVLFEPRSLADFTIKFLTVSKQVFYLEKKLDKKILLDNLLCSICETLFILCVWLAIWYRYNNAHHVTIKISTRTTN